MQEVKLGKYKHFKGNFYEVIAIGKHSETLEEMVVYKALHKEEDEEDYKIWIRPKSLFLLNVIINGNEIPRFKYLDDDKYVYEE